MRTDPLTPTPPRWLIPLVLAALGAFGIAGLEAPGFVPWQSELDLSQRAALPALSGAEIVVRNPKYPNVVDVLDRGGPLRVTVSLPQADTCRLRVKLGIAGVGQPVTVAWNGQVLGTVTGTRGGPAEKFALRVPIHATRAGDNTVTFTTQGPAGSVRYEHVRWGNYRARLVKHGWYLVDRAVGPHAWEAIRRQTWRTGLVLAALIPAAIWCAIVALQWCSGSPVWATRWAWGASWGTALLVLGLRVTPLVSPYQMVFMPGVAQQLVGALWGGIIAFAVLLNLVRRGCIATVRLAKLVGDYGTRQLEHFSGVVVDHAATRPQQVWRHSRALLMLLARIGWVLGRMAARLVWWLLGRALPAVISVVVRWIWHHQSAPGYVTIFAVLLAASWICRWLGWRQWAPGLEDAAWVAILISAALYAVRALQEESAERLPPDA